MTNLYLQFKNNKQEKINNFNIMYAFDKQQFENGLERLGVNSNEVVSIGGGGYIRKSDIQAFKEMFEDFKNEHNENMKNDDYVYHMFKYEMANNEYIMTYNDYEVLSTCDIEKELFMTDKRLQSIFTQAKNDYIEEMTS